MSGTNIYRLVLIYVNELAPGCLISIHLAGWFTEPASDGEIAQAGSQMFQSHCLFVCYCLIEVTAAVELI